MTAATPLALKVLGVGFIAPGLPDWQAAQAVLSGRAPYAPAPSVVPAPQRLPAAERRRAGLAVKLAMAVADAACAHAGLDPAELATVFTSSSGDGANCHALCDMLAGPDRLISPTRFTNSVHNAPAGYWHIAVSGRQASTSLCAHDASFGAGLLEAALQVRDSGQPLLFVTSDVPYPEPLHATRALPDSVGLALVLAPAGPATPRALGRLRVGLVDAREAGPPTPCRDDRLTALTGATPAARGLPLLQALAGHEAVVTLIGFQPQLHLRVEVTPAPGAGDGPAEPSMPA